MVTLEKASRIHAEMAEWRHDIHAHPETAFEEQRTSALVAQKLETFGLSIHRGLGRTGVVGTLSAGSGRRAIGLRADMDALHIHEKNAFGHRSQHEGKMHACGHDGHIAMLLGAAKYLAESRNFDGTVYFIFQPAEENEGGGREMVEQGLFEKFPCESVYGMHNWPGMPVGQFGVRAGPTMASFDIFEIELTGRGSHAALPHTGIDSIIAASALVQALQTITSRNVDPIESAVVSVTQIHAGDTWNVIPDAAVVRGTARAFTTEVRDLLERRLREICTGIAAAHNAQIKVRYERRYPPLVNAAPETEICSSILQAMVGPDKVLRVPAVMGSEDFAFMLQAKAGCYVFVGNGPGEGGCMLHNPHYDFNDQILPLGASYWVNLVEHILATKA